MPLKNLVQKFSFVMHMCKIIRFEEDGDDSNLQRQK